MHVHVQITKSLYTLYTYMYSVHVNVHVHCTFFFSCKRANDWISEAKYPVITRDSSETAGPTGGGTPVVLGKIKRVKSMQPKPLEEEIAKSLGEWIRYS